MKMWQNLDMKIHNRRNILSFIVVPLGCLSFVCLGVGVHWILALLVFPFVLIAKWFDQEIVCQNCGKPIGKHYDGAFGFRFVWWSPFTGRQCHHCGKNFDEWKTLKWQRSYPTITRKERIWCPRKTGLELGRYNNQLLCLQQRACSRRSWFYRGS